jgi:ubiquinone biosynthesis protein UbiJ
MDIENITEFKKFIKSSIKTSVGEATEILKLNQDTNFKIGFEKITLHLAEIVRDLNDKVVRLEKRIEIIEKKMNIK